VDLIQFLEGDLSADLRGGEFEVAKHLLDEADVGASHG